MQNYKVFIRWRTENDVEIKIEVDDGNRNSGGHCWQMNKTKLTSAFWFNVNYNRSIVIRNSFAQILQIYAEPHSEIEVEFGQGSTLQFPISD